MLHEEMNTLAEAEEKEVRVTTAEEREKVKGAKAKQTKRKKALQKTNQPPSKVLQSRGYIVGTERGGVSCL